MANVQKCAQGTEGAGDSLVAIINKALGYPKRGSHIGGGVHVTMPASWDGSGATPPGWTKQATANWVAAALDAAVPISDALATELQLPANLALLSAGEQTTLLAAISARANVDLETGIYIPKANAAAVGAAVAGEKKP